PRDIFDFVNPRSLARDDVLVAATLGRGVWTVSNADASLAEPAVITIKGGTGDDTIIITRRASNASILDVFVNSAVAPALSVPVDGVQKIEFFGMGGKNTLKIDSSHGPISVPGGVHFDGGDDDAGAAKDEIILEGPAVEVSREETGKTVTLKISDASTTSPQIVILDSVEVETNHLVEPSIFDKIGALLRRFFNWISSFFTDHPAPGAGAERELALVGRSLPRALTGVSAEQISAVSNPQSGEGQVAQEPISGSATIDHPGLQRLIEEGKNGFSLDDIGKLIASPADLAARLDALDSTPGNVTFDNTSDTDGDGKPDLRFDVKIQKPLNGTADFDLDTSLLGGAIRLNGEIAVGADIVLNLAFGVESSKGPFIETGGGRGLSVSNISLSSNIDAGGQFGFLGVEVAEPTVTIDPALAINIALRDPAGTGKIRLSDLTKSLLDPARLSDLATFNISGSAGDDLGVQTGGQTSSLLPGLDAPF